MLYDPKWEQKTKADPHSLAALIAWLEWQERKGIYCYGSSGECLLARYFSGLGLDRVIVGVSFYAHGTPFHSVGMPQHFNDVAGGHPRTFGAALERARKAAAA